ncbi:hypothetical protein C8J57DRAFT_1238192 [Mycena rebaudengoi]|nr:hypothetical protein C8J57DRAFT_1238192 [Mycena rebaudengoi]
MLPQRCGSSIGANPHATPQRAMRTHAPGLNPAPKHYRTTASPPPPPPRRPPPAAASRTTRRTLRTLRTLQPSYNHLHYSFNASGAAFTLGNNCARCALFRHPPFPPDLWATRWLHPPTKTVHAPGRYCKNFDPPVLAVPPIARHSTAAVVSLATARFAVSYRRGGSNLMGDIYSTEGSDFWGLRGPNSSSFRSILAPISHPALTRHPLAYGAPLAAPLAALQTARCGAFSPMMSPTVTRCSYTPTDSIFEFLDLENGGPLTHASHRPPRRLYAPVDLTAILRRLLAREYCRTTTFRLYGARAVYAPLGKTLAVWAPSEFVVTPIRHRGELCIVSYHSTPSLTTRFLSVALGVLANSPPLTYISLFPFCAVQYLFILTYSSRTTRHPQLFFFFLLPESIVLVWRAVQLYLAFLHALDHGAMDSVKLWRRGSASTTSAPRPNSRSFKRPSYSYRTLRRTWLERGGSGTPQLFYTITQVNHGRWSTGELFSIHKARGENTYH